MSSDGIDERNFLGLFDLDPAVKLADHHQGPLTFELLDELINDIPIREAAQHEAHMEFILNEHKWKHVIMQAFDRGEFDTARTRQMIRNMQVGVPYEYCYMDEAKLPRFTRLRRILFKVLAKECPQ